MSSLEWIAAVTTLLNVFLVMRGSIWNWVWGTIATVLYGYVFYAGALYANMWLNVAFFLPMQAIGWWVWLKGGPTKRDDLPITRLSTSMLLGWLSAGIPLSAVWGYLAWWLAVQAHQPIAPLPIRIADAFTTGFSVIGQLLLTRKIRESWIFWIVVNGVYGFYLFPMQRLFPSAALYTILLALAIQGWRAWSR